MDILLPTPSAELVPMVCHIELLLLLPPYASLFILQTEPKFLFGIEYGSSIFGPMNNHSMDYKLLLEVVWRGGGGGNTVWRRVRSGSGRGLFLDLPF